jgi:hypothetical protein
MGGSLGLPTLLCARITPKFHFGVMLACYFSRTSKLDRRCLSDDEPSSLADDLVLENPGSRARLSNTKPKTRNGVVKPNAIRLARLELKSLR